MQIVSYSAIRNCEIEVLDVYKSIPFCPWGQARRSQRSSCAMEPGNTMANPPLFISLVFPRSPVNAACHFSQVFWSDGETRSTASVKTERTLYHLPITTWSTPVSHSWLLPPTKYTGRNCGDIRKVTPVVKPLSWKTFRLRDAISNRERRRLSAAAASSLGY